MEPLKLDMKDIIIKRRSIVLKKLHVEEYISKSDSKVVFIEKEWSIMT